MNMIPAIWLWHPSHFYNKELTYSVKSVKKFCPWVSDCYVVSEINPHVDGLIWIEIEPSDKPIQLKTFNSIVFGAEYIKTDFLYMNDDWYFLDDTTKEEFDIPFAYGYVCNRKWPKIHNDFSNFRISLVDTLIQTWDRYECNINFTGHAPLIINMNDIENRLKEFPYTGQFETWLFSSRNPQWRPADLIRAMWTTEPHDVRDLEMSVFSGGRKMLSHDDGIFGSNYENTALWDLLDKYIK